MNYSPAQIIIAMKRAGVLGLKRKAVADDLQRQPPAVPAHRGFADLGRNTYTLFTSKREGAHELYILAGEQERPNQEAMTVMLRFSSIEGLATLEKQIALIREQMVAEIPTPVEVPHHGV